MSYSIVAQPLQLPILLSKWIINNPLYEFNRCRIAALRRCEQKKYSPLHVWDMAENCSICCHHSPSIRLPLQCSLQFNYKVEDYHVIHNNAYIFLSIFIFCCFYVTNLVLKALNLSPSLSILGHFLLFLIWASFSSLWSCANSIFLLLL